MLTRAGRFALAHSAAVPWTNVYGVARTSLALGLAATLIFSDTGSVFFPTVEIPQRILCSGAARAGLFCVAGAGHLELARWAGVAILLVTATGIWPRVTAVPFAWVAFSFAATSRIPDGGDQITELLSLMLIPVSLTDARRTHWDPPPAPESTASWARILAWSALFVIRLQIAGVYFQAAVSKLGVREWADGTALYYWINAPSYGASGWIRSAFEPFLWNPWFVALLTWGSLAAEFAIFLGLFLPQKKRRWLLLEGLLFHLGIAVVMGLVSFFFAVAAGLVLFLWPVDRPVRWPDRFRRPVRDRAFETGGTAGTTIEPAEVT
ncbi:sporulation-delaying protein SdpB family protein [Actinomadura bangladeshensis]|uniref:HTTM-like domain-containing protein n=1 Tax=Actinomadura bangladeshensis TaxID=453573 RepID=A0A4R4PEH2_9ACTN|nr:sporulation-delaying protein SdpB family protein [Actinomadura bangladeshensis]TDC20037.1 hypothetical protein E1284_01405 [Actinomadura bangladeshensis]